METDPHPTEPDDLYNFLITIDPQGLEPDKSLEYMARLVDLSLDLRQPAGLQIALEWGKKLQQQELNSRQHALLHYFYSNVWANLRDLPRIVARTENGHLEDAEKQAWEWEQEETEKQIFHLRSALRETDFQALPQLGQCNVLTNLANLYDTVGRFVEAIEYWERAIAIDSSFGMAYGNKGIGLVHYAYLLYDPGHRVMFLQSALSDLKATDSTDLHPGARESFRRKKDQVETILSSISSQHDIDVDDHPLGDSTQETQYRQWCLENRLFLNPLNDIGPYPIAARDIFSAPDIVYGLEESPYYHGYFDQMKQEFVSARYLYFEGVTTSSSHFSDKGVLLYNTLDYPVYSLSLEKVKAAYRIAYSLFDKAAYFLNAYLRLSIPERQVSFRTFWYNKRRRKEGLRSEFKCRPNLPLRGLFWLGKDLFEDKLGFKDSTAPDAQHLAAIRNHLEHKYLKIHDDMWRGDSGDNQAADKANALLSLKDVLAFSLYRKDFHNKTLRLLKTARAVLIYLSLAIHREEDLKHREQDSEGLVVSQFLDTWEDEWKT